MTILSEYSLWLLLVCILVGVIYSFLLYYKNKNIDYSKSSTRIMSILRGVSITLICALLLLPMIKRTVKQREKPLIVLAVDNSESIVMGKDSAWYRNEFPKAYLNFVKSLGDNYEIVQYKIGDNISSEYENKVQSFDFQDKTTNISQIFDEISNQYVNRNVGAMVLFSDGIYNAGNNPYYLTNKLNFQVFTVGMGNPEQQTDLSIAGIENNKQTFKGNFFPVEIKIAASKLSGKKTKLTVVEGEQEILNKDIMISSSQFFENVKFTIEAKEKGVHRYRVYLENVDGETNYRNNESSFFIEVVDQREKIAIIFDAPHPDVAAIKSAIEKSDKYQIETFSLDKFNGKLDGYSLVILHQIPANSQNGANLLAQINSSRISTLYIIGNQSNLNLFNAQNVGLTIQRNKNLTNEAVPAFNNNFTSFTFSEEAKQMLPHFPPLSTPFGDYKSAVSAHTFLYQKISNVETHYPLIQFNDNNGRKIGVISGTGIWQWKVYDYLYAENHLVFDEIVNKMVLFLSVKSDKSLFRVFSKNLYGENNNIVFTAEVYNESYELINLDDVEIKITGSKGKEYNAVFSKQNNSYSLDLGQLPADDYKWTATAGKHTKSGAFTVQELVLESSNLVANHSLLNSISEATNGKYYDVKNFAQIAENIKANDEIKSIVSYNKKYNLILGSWFYFLLIVLLLGVEWFMRKWGGGY